MYKSYSHELLLILLQYESDFQKRGKFNYHKHNQIKWILHNMIISVCITEQLHLLPTRAPMKNLKTANNCQELAKALPRETASSRE